MEQYISKSALVAEMNRRMNEINLDSIDDWRYRLQREHDIEVMKNILSIIDTLEVKDPYEQCVQYPSIEDGIKAHAEVYSFNIESELFNQLTKEQQALWRKEIEQACISGGDAGYLLARDPRYNENLEVKEINLEKEIDNIWNPHFNLGWDEKSLISMNHEGFTTIAKHFFELGLKDKKGE